MLSSHCSPGTWHLTPGTWHLTPGTIAQLRQKRMHHQDVSMMQLFLSSTVTTAADVLPAACFFRDVPAMLTKAVRGGLGACCAAARGHASPILP
jgi:hypothetical protein